MTLKRFLLLWSFAGVDSLHIGPIMTGFDVLVDNGPSKQLNKQWSCRSFETSLRSCVVTVTRIPYSGDESALHAHDTRFGPSMQKWLMVQLSRETIFDHNVNTCRPITHTSKFSITRSSIYRHIWEHRLIIMMYKLIWRPLCGISIVQLCSCHVTRLWNNNETVSSFLSHWCFDNNNEIMRF